MTPGGEVKKMASDYRRLSLSIVKFKANPDNLKPEKRKSVSVNVKGLLLGSFP